MKKYRLVDNDELIATQEDLQSLIRNADVLETPSASNCGKSYFLRTSCWTDGIFYLRGYVYKCESYYIVDPVTGIKTLAYRWVVATYTESGALDKVSNFRLERISSGLSESGVKLSWTDPEDKKYKDSVNNASWAFTLIVRKAVQVDPSHLPDEDDLRQYAPKTIDDGETVGMSGVRNQYSDPNINAFNDHYPTTSTAHPYMYVYNIFAVTKYGVATGLDLDESHELTWKDVLNIIRSGHGGSLFSIGDCVTIDHTLLGSIDLQVAHMGLVPVRMNDGSMSAQFGVVFMSRYCLPRCTYDAKEHHTARSGSTMTVNPADKISAADEMYYASNRGRADWKTSNLRQFLNKSTSFTRSLDRKWDLEKYYFVLDEGNYVQVPIPVWPDRVDPYQLGYFEARYNFEQQHVWDRSNSEAEQPCVYGKRELPGFYDFLPADLREVLADVIVPTIGSNLTNEPVVARLEQGTKATLSGTDVPTVFLNGQLAEDKLTLVEPSTVLSDDYQYVKHNVLNDTWTIVNKSSVDKNSGEYFYYNPGDPVKYPVVLTDDRIFIPSYKELFGTNCDRMFSSREGDFWSLYNPAVEIPTLGFTRSHLKYDVAGQLSGYYTRSLGLVEAAGGSRILIGDSTVWTVKSKGFTSPPPLGAKVTDTVSCSMTKVAAAKQDANGTFVAPAVAWCCVVAYTGREV